MSIWPGWNASEFGWLAYWIFWSLFTIPGLWISVGSGGLLIACPLLLIAASMAYCATSKYTKEAKEEVLPIAQKQ
jgi:hypothetical protein